MNLCCQAVPNGLATAVKISPSFTFTLRIHGEQFFIAHVDVDVERGKQKNGTTTSTSAQHEYVDIHSNIHSGQAFVSEAAENLHAVSTG